MVAEALIVPLVIDLDGTLIKTDSLDETLLDVLRIDPSALLALPYTLLRGRPATKAYLASRSPLDIGAWPVNDDFLGFIQSEVARGRKIVLATAADQSVAQAIANRFDFISEVIASDGRRNLKGRAKAAQLRERFPGGFIYAGNSAADLHVWREGSDSVIVNAPAAVLRKAAQHREPLAVFSGATDKATALWRSIRLHQWAKNALVFVPLVLGGRSGDVQAWVDAFVGSRRARACRFGNLCHQRSDRSPSDRQHWSKRSRPLASGDLSVRTGIAVAVAGLICGLGLAALEGMAALTMVIIYIAASLSYSFKLKQVPIVDVFMLASLFTLRLYFGIVLTGVVLSPWLMSFSMFVFLSLSVAKRHTEVLKLAERGLTNASGRGYAAADSAFTLGLGIASMMGSVIILILYLIEDAFPRGVYAHPQVLWAIPPILFLFLGRVWLRAQRGQLDDDPVAFVLKDRTSLLLGLMMCATFAAALVKVSWP